MDLIEFVGSTSAPSTGFSTPPSSSLDTCDSGIDLYSNSFTLISSVNSSKNDRTTSTQIDQSDSSPESAQSFDENSITECKFYFVRFSIKSTSNVCQ